MIWFGMAFLRIRIGLENFLVFVRPLLNISFLFFLILIIILHKLKCHTFFGSPLAFIHNITIPLHSVHPSYTFRFIFVVFIQINIIFDIVYKVKYRMQCTNTDIIILNIWKSMCALPPPTPTPPLHTLITNCICHQQQRQQSYRII